MNILFVTDVSISNASSGSERVLFEESILLAKRGHDVHILTRKLKDHKSNSEMVKGVREWRYYINQKNDLTFIKTTLSNCRKLFERLQNEYFFDCINFHQPFSAFAIIHSSAVKKAKKIYTCHSLSFEEFQSRNPKPKGITRRVLYFLNIQARKWVEKRALNASDKIAVLSRFTLGKLRNVYGIPSAKIEIMPGGVDSQKFFPAINRVEVRRRLNIPEDKMVLLTVRDLEPRMGLENLIYAIKKVIKVVPDSYLILGGKGPLQKTLISLSQKAGVRDYIRFVGFIPDEDLPDYYRAADIFILPTKELEGFGLVTLEALASGIPVLGTPVGGTAEILDRLDPNFLFKDTTPESMAELIIDTWKVYRDNPRQWKEVSSRCRKFAVENYSWDKNVNILEKLFSI